MNERLTCVGSERHQSTGRIVKCPSCSVPMQSFGHPRCPYCGAQFDAEFTRRATSHEYEPGPERALIRMRTHAASKAWYDDGDPAAAVEDFAALCLLLLPLAAVVSVAALRGSSTPPHFGFALFFATISLAGVILKLAHAMWEISGTSARIWGRVWQRLLALACGSASAVVAAARSLTEPIRPTTVRNWVLGFLTVVCLVASTMML